MKLALGYKSNLLALLKIVQQKHGWADSKVSKLCFGYGDFIGAFRKWTGGKKGPTLEKTMVLEQFLREQIGEEEYQKFLAGRVPADDFDD